VGAARVAAGRGVGEVERAEAAVEEEARGEVADAEGGDSCVEEVEGCETAAGLGESLGEGESKGVIDGRAEKDSSVGP
jgi:hypothetical protein